MPIDASVIENAPRPAGPYSHSVVANGEIYTAGFGPHDPATGEVVAGGVYEQTVQVLRNLRNVLSARGAGLDNVVKVTAHLQHLKRDFAEYNRAYAEFFTAPFPVRTTVGSELYDILVEIDVVAIRPNG